MLYNGMDERIQVVTTPAIGAADTRVYLYDLDHRIVGEYGATGTADIKAEYIWLMPEVGATGPTGGDDGLGGYMPLATAVGQTGTLNWLHTHHHGAPILTTNAAGTIVPYPAHAVLGFPGQFANSQQLAGAQHYYNRYRDYDVNTGRYIQADPIGLAGDDNPYAYAGGNPLRYKDPSGEFAFLFVPAACVGGGCQTAVATTGILVAGIVAWVATHPVIPWGETLPPSATPCPDSLGPIILHNQTRRPPEGARDRYGPKAPGKPGKAEGFEDPKNGEAWGKAPNGEWGWVDKNGNVWVPTRGRGAHGGDHWDIQPGRGGPRPRGEGNVYPGGRRR